MCYVKPIKAVHQPAIFNPLHQGQVSRAAAQQQQQQQGVQSAQPHHNAEASLKPVDFEYMQALYGGIPTDPFAAAGLLPMTSPWTSTTDTMYQDLINGPAIATNNMADFTLYAQPEAFDPLDTIFSEMGGQDSTLSIGSGVTMKSEPSDSSSPATLVDENEVAHLSPEENPGSRKRRASEDQDEDEFTLIKRKKNTEAARRCRQRKVQRLGELQLQVDGLEADKSELLTKVAILESERKLFQERENAMVTRIAELERQLSESHRAMLEVGLRKA
ncbi:hypothetical protein BC832DRAFT_407812 [Gaertneriomyces semiglobifer]|nr:hypothetical protein BC832DRAFT_407812 [Gaertneriomyces semiglobifer]